MSWRTAAALLAPSLLAAGLGASCGAEVHPSRPNILLIVADDLAAGAVGYEGNPIARTPNLDALAHAGTSFARAYVPTPQCAPSRAALLLGVYPHQSGLLSNSLALSDQRLTLARSLSDAGYRSGFVGKWHLGEDEKPRPGFESWCAIDRKHLSYFDPLLWIDGRREPRTGYVPDVLTDEALRFLDAADPAQRPFFLWLAYTSPHEPITPPPDPGLAHDPATIPLPPADDDLAGKPAVQRESEGHRIYLERGPNGIRKVLAVYQAMVDALDRDIGRVLAHLDQRGQTANTLVVFLSDNGTLRGEHQMVTKGPAFYEELVRTPLVVRWPLAVRSGTRLDALTTTLDLFPTLARAGGAEVPADLPGADLLPLLKGQVASVHDEIYLEYARKQPDDPPTPMLGLVTKRHKLVRYLGTSDEEFYDLGADPREDVNLVNAPAAPSELAALRARLSAFQGEAGPDFR